MISALRERLAAQPGEARDRQCGERPRGRLRHGGGDERDALEIAIGGGLGQLRQAIAGHGARAGVAQRIDKAVETIGVIIARRVGGARRGSPFHWH